MFKSNQKKEATMELMEMRPAEFPRILIEYNALLKMHQIVQTCSAEVGWLGSVEINDGAYVITDVYLLKQKVTGTTTDLDENALSDLLYNILESDPEKYNTIKLWGHSHVNMPCVPSGTDDSTFKEYYVDNPFFIRLIANKKEEMRIDIAIKEDGVIYKKVPWEVIYPFSIIEAMDTYDEVLKLLEAAEANVNEIKNGIEASFKEELASEIKEKVIEEKKYTSYYSSYWKDKDKKEEKQETLPYKWQDEEMDDYSNWYDYYGYQGECEYEDVYNEEEEKIMKSCDTGKKIKCGSQKVPLSELFDNYEILEFAETTKNWKELRNVLMGDQRVTNYHKQDFIDMLDSVRTWYREYKRRISA